MLKCDQPEKPRKIYQIPKVSKKRAAAIADGSYKPKVFKITIKYHVIKPRSDKRAKQERLYSNLAIWFKAKHPICQRCNINKTQDVHHSKGRTGVLLTEVKYFVALCRKCHTEIELNPDQAKAEGLSKSRLTN